MRVLFCTLDYPPSAAGGAEHQASLQAEELVRRGYSVDVVCARTPGQTSGLRNGVYVHRLHRVEVRALRTITYLVMLGLWLAWSVRRYHLVHVHLANLQADVAVAIARAGRRPTYLKVAAGGPLGEIGRMRLIAPITRYYGLRHADLVQAISDEIAHDLEQVDIPSERIRRIPNGVVVPDAPPTHAVRHAARARLGLLKDRSIVLYAGRMEREKGVADLVEVWRRNVMPDATLLLVGSAGRKDPVPLTDLPEGVQHRGWTSSVADYLLAADLLALPSYTEGMSNALLEAMAAGVPCVATRVGAAEEMLEQGDAGFLVMPGDVEELARVLGDALADPGLRERVAERARQLAGRRYDIGAVVDSIEAAYRELVPAS